MVIYFVRRLRKVSLLDFPRGKRKCGHLKNPLAARMSRGEINCSGHKLDYKFQHYV